MSVVGMRKGGGKDMKIEMEAEENWKAAKILVLCH